MTIRYRNNLLASTLLVGAAAIANPAFAQTASTDTSAETSSSDIVVTGTLVRNPNLVSSVPVTVIGSEEIALRQRNTAEELVRDLPGVTPSIGSAVNNGNGGAAYADLRGLGNFRNVVLIDGNRIVPSSATGRTDLNNIPLALIERADVLTGGAATTYGADAVSGVLNFITRQDFSGFEANVSNQITQRGDGNVFRGDLTVGANFDDGKGNAVLSIGYQKAKPVYQGARTFSQNQYTSTSGFAGGSGTTTPSRFTTGGSAYSVIDQNTGAVRAYRSRGTAAAPSDAFNFAPYNIFQTPFKRFNIYGAGHYDVADGIQVYTRGTFSKNTVNTIIAPSGVFGSQLTIPYSNPYLTPALRAAMCAGNGLTTAQCNAASLATSPTDPNFRTFNTTVGRRTTEVGPRVSEYVTTMFDYRAGAKFDITNSINLDINGSYGESENRQTQSGYVLLSRVRSAVYATNTTSCLGNAPNGAPLTAGTGCVPLNLFGPTGSIAANQIPYLTGNSFSQQKASLAQARALLTGDFGVTSPWASDPISFAAGTEYRKYTASQSADSLSQTAGELGGAGGAITNFNGGYDVVEGYSEVIAPLVSDKPGFESLTVEGGLRYSKYSVDAPGKPSFKTTTYKGGLTWEPISGIKFRGEYQRAVRAPNITELFAPSVVGLTNLSYDPCAGAAPTTNANLRAVCLAQGAPANSIGRILVPTGAQAAATTSGNLGLRPEKSDSYTLGIVLQPKGLIPGLSITVDYYHIKIKDAISQPTPDDAINLCFGNRTGAGISAAAASNPLCTAIRRNPVTGGLDGDPATTGGLNFVASNAGQVLTDGIDFGFNYRRDLGFAKLDLGMQGNYTRRAEFQATPVSIVRDCVGVYSTSCGSPASAGPSSSAGSLQPKFTFQQRTTLSRGALDVSLLWRHISPMNAEDGTTTFNGTIAGNAASNGALAGRTYNFGHIKAYDYFDLAFRVGVTDNLDVTLTVTNLLDKAPPIVGNTIGSTSFNSGNTYPSTYDALGRRFLMGAKLKF
ncbi:TonB-dependent receptor [Sphingomonas sp. AP4-R1]|uniref:TonB-dependent receptor domain-containing protein n=1 Tax=Sphingomonas sp. AP4-R1 TaxID=2735134 RepID=UPI001493DDCE|nr:TonB-dependent receptor [Sphingomonas sp. AP4-R1]QJU59659.1 TonB-dependent receptor [Sphingomonas sp. AP4-R1]